MAIDAQHGLGVSRFRVSKTILNFPELSEDFSHTPVSEKRSFTVLNGGSNALWVTVNPPTGSQFFRITAGQGTTLIQPHGGATVTVEFAPTHSGSFSGSIAIKSDATAGTRSEKILLAGSARRKKRPTPTGTLTPTPTGTPTPTVTASATRTATATVTVTATPTATASATPTLTPTATVTVTASATPTSTGTATQTASVTSTPTATASASPTRTSTSSPTSTPTATVTATTTATATPSRTSTATTTTP